MRISMNWRVNYSNKAAKQYRNVPDLIRDLMDALVKEIEMIGPVRGNWKHYSKLSETKHHCHLKAGRPTYVACWEVINKTIRTVEVYYVGTHEKAPY